MLIDPLGYFYFYFLYGTVLGPRFTTSTNAEVARNLRLVFALEWCTVGRGSRGSVGRPLLLRRRRGGQVERSLDSLTSN